MASQKKTQLQLIFGDFEIGIKNKNKTSKLIYLKKTNTKKSRLKSFLRESAK